MTARVPMVNKASGVKRSSSGLRCATTRMAFSSLATAASTAATELSRPTESGKNKYGNNVVFLSGSTGNVATGTTGGGSVTVVTRQPPGEYECATCRCETT